MGGNSTVEYLGLLLLCNSGWSTTWWSTTAAITPHPGVPGSACAGRDMPQNMTRGSRRPSSPVT